MATKGRCLLRAVKLWVAKMMVTAVSVCLILGGCSTGFDAPAAKQKQRGGKNYNYFFKVVVSEDVARSMTYEDNNRIATKINKVGAFLEGRVDTSDRNVLDDPTAAPAAVAAAVFVSEGLRNALDELAEENVTVILSYQELLADAKGSLGDAVRSVSSEARVFVYGGPMGKVDPMNSDSWSREKITNPGFRSDTFINTAEPETTLTIDDGLAVPVADPVLFSDFYTNLVEQVAADPSVSITAQDETTFALTTEASTMVVETEAEVTADELRSMAIAKSDFSRGWLKRAIKKVAAEVRRYTNTCGSGVWVKWGGYVVVAGVVYYFFGIAVYPIIDAKGCIIGAAGTGSW